MALSGAMEARPQGGSSQAVSSSDPLSLMSQVHSIFNNRESSSASGRPSKTSASAYTALGVTGTSLANIEGGYFMEFVSL